MIHWNQVTERNLYKKLDLYYFGFLLRKPGTMDWKTLSHLILQSLNLVIRKLTSSKQLVCKINQEIHHWASTWCRSEGILQKALHELGKKLILILRPLEFGQPTSTTVSFSKDPSVRYCAGSWWTTYSWKDLNRNMSKNNTTKKY
jgi:hypothetical protein